MRGSEYFEKYKPGYDIWISFRFSNGVWNISLYSNTVDVSEIAKQFCFEGRRGGGHKKAAGFVAVYPPFLPFVSVY
jgi:nanoRNase/pAp phosphatase (c-di-AMP/oligoRNAs hydrolase)